MRNQTSKNSDNIISLIKLIEGKKKRHTQHRRQPSPQGTGNAPIEVKCYETPPSRAGYASTETCRTSPCYSMASLHAPCTGPSQEPKNSSKITRTLIISYYMIITKQENKSLYNSNKVSQGNQLIIPSVLVFRLRLAVFQLFVSTLLKNINNFSMLGKIILRLTFINGPTLKIAFF